MLDHFAELGLDALVSIGGDGSMRIAERFRALGMPIVGVGARPVGGATSEAAAAPGEMPRKRGAAQALADALGTRTSADVRVTEGTQLLATARAMGIVLGD